MYIYNEMLLHHKKEILPFVTSMDLKGIMLSEISQTEKRQAQYDLLICGILKFLDTENRFLGDRGRGWMAREMRSEGTKFE